jgi:hypothetical protein
MNTLVKRITPSHRGGAMKACLRSLAVVAAATALVAGAGTMAAWA